MPVKTVKIWVWVANIVAVAMIAALVVFGRTAADKFEAVNDRWRDYNEKAAAKNQLMLALRSELGYGGFIHNFKNFVLRRDARLKQRIILDIERMHVTIGRLYTLMEGQVEDDALRAIHVVLKDYFEKFETAARLVDAGRAPAYIDSLVKVNDGPAIKGFAALEQSFKNRSVEMVVKTDRQLKEALAFLSLGSFLIVFVIAATIAINLFLRRVAADNQRIQAADQMKSSFMANMSHEIRTPMNAIVGLTGLALRTELTDKQRDYLEKVRTSSQSLLGIINDILDFSKIEAGKLDVEEIDFKLDEVLENLTDMIAGKLIDRPVELVIRVEPNMPMDLRGDPLRLGQVLINLVGNAVKFTQEGEVLVEVVSLGLDDDKVNVRFSVSDTGIGMSEEQAARLFSPFTQADATTTRRFGGTGLGLAICKNLVELMGGEIGVRSVEGQGSTFWFSLPFPRLAKVRKQVRDVASDLRGMRVMVVDDNATARTVFGEMLESMGFDVTAVHSGPAALAEMSRSVTDSDEKPYQLILMDWAMPGMDGVETIRELKKIDDGIELPAIVTITAYARDEVRAMAENEGISAFLTKPVNQSTLLDAIMEIFVGKSEPAALSS